MKEIYTAHTKPFSYITSPLLDSHGIRHAFTRKDGGVSSGVYQSLNFATGSGTPADAWENVLSNHRIAAGLFGLTESDICRTNQTHSLTVKRADRSLAGTGLTRPPFEEGVDGLVCAEEGVLLTVRGADCITLLFYDTANRICGACHSGWRGTAGGIALHTLSSLRAMGADMKSTLVAIGPSVQGCCYRVGEEVYNAFIAADSGYSACFTQRADGLYLSLQQAICHGLMQAGIKEEHISDCGECTVCDSQNYFSHRRSGIMRGTMAAFITV